jgi:hypothetical protein
MPQHFPKTEAELKSYLQQLKAGSVEPLPASEILKWWPKADSTFRARLVWALGESGDKIQAAPHLIESLNDPDGNIRRLAAPALAKLKCREAVPALLDCLRKESKPQVRQYVVKALCTLCDAPNTQVTQALQEIISDEQAPAYLVRTAHEALNRMKGVEPAREHTRSEPKPVRFVSKLMEKVSRVTIHLDHLYEGAPRLDELPDYVDEACALAGEGKEIILTGAAPVWLYLKIAHALHGKAGKLIYSSPITGEVVIFVHNP